MGAGLPETLLWSEDRNQLPQALELLSNISTSVGGFCASLLPV